MKSLLKPAIVALITASTVSADVLISEFLARNETGLRDMRTLFGGEISDWIEITNTGVEAVDLTGWSLTDDADRLRKWRFPEATLEAGERRVIFATGLNLRDPAGQWHTNFRLGATGDYLALVMPDGDTIATEYQPVAQFDDRSYGLDPVTGTQGYLVEPTPAMPNSDLVYPGPVISEPTHSPEPLMPSEDVVVAVRVEARGGAIDSVTLHLRVDYKPESTAAMNDAGNDGDAVANDGIYSATIAGRTLFGPRIPPHSMIRWYVSAEDVDAKSARFPPFLDSDGNDQAAEYLGTVAIDSDIDTDLPVLQWYTEDVTRSRNRTGARASAFYNGSFYDNIYVRQRGGATNGASQKFLFNRAYPIAVNDEIGVVTELNLNAQGSDPTYLRQPLAFESYRWAGNASCLSFLTLMFLNGDEDRTGVLIEQVDEDFLERNGFDPFGDLYKLVQRSNLDPVFADITTGIEKKTGDLDDLSTIKSLVDGLALGGDERKAYLMDAMNLPQVMNYLSIRSVTQDADDVRKNFYVYHDTLNTGEWSIFPWDKDWTFGVTGDGGTFLKHPFFGDQARRKDNANQWNRLYDALFDEPVTKQMYLRRLRTLMDTLLQPEGTPESELRFENRVDEMFAMAEGDVPASGPNMVKRFFPERRRDLFETYRTASLIPSEQPVSPKIEFGAIEFQPGSGNQDEEYIELVNGESTAIDISGWTLSGGVAFTFAEGTVIPASSLFSPGLDKMYVSPDVVAFRARGESPKGGEGQFVQGSYDGHLSNRGETLTLKDRDGVVINEISYEGNPSDVEKYLAISEIMYHPADPNSTAEYLELTNLSDEVTLDLTGLTFTQGIAFDFADGTMIAPGGYALIVRDAAAFEAAYGAGLPVIGAFADDTRLNDGGETIKLEGAGNNTILEFRYNNNEPWPIDADGGGPALVLNDPMTPNDVESWSSAPATPGKASQDSPSGDDFVDQDGDGLVALIEEAFGTSDLDANEGPGTVTIRADADNIIVATIKNPASALVIQLQSSPDLITWSSVEIEGQVTNEPDKSIIQWTLARDPANASAYRIQVRR